MSFSQKQNFENVKIVHLGYANIAPYLEYINELIRFLIFLLLDDEETAHLINVLFLYLGKAE